MTGTYSPPEPSVTALSTKTEEPSTLAEDAGLAPFDEISPPHPVRETANIPASKVLYLNFI
jgi:hypothetical protein